jgi:transposase
MAGMSNACQPTHSIDSLHRTIADMADEIKRLKEQLHLATRKQFGKQSEAFSPDQGLLFTTDDVEIITTDLDEEDETSNPPKSNRSPTRQSVMVKKGTPVERRELDLDDADKQCDCCGGELHKIGEDCSYQLEYIPAQTKVIETARPKYGCRDCETGIKQRPVPASPIPRSMATPSILSYLIISKYLDHQPLNRIERILSRHGIRLPRSTQCDWLMACAKLLKPLVVSMRTELLQSPQVFTDDTILPLQNDIKGRDRTIQSRMWVYATQERTGPPMVLYDFTRTRQKEGPHAFMKGYKGYVQADAYAGYDGLYAQGAKEVACMAHLRRKFFEVYEQEKTPGPAHEVLAQIAQLYKLEKRIKHLSHKKRKKQRRLHAKPLLKRLRRWLEREQLYRLPKGKLAKAIGYALNHWAAFERYCEAGYLEIDNNFSERQMKPIALGRKNYLTTGSERGGAAAAVFYSLVESAKINQLNVYDYLVDVLSKIPNRSDEELSDLLPYIWQSKKEQA